MFRLLLGSKTGNLGFPRVRGDVPLKTCDTDPQKVFPACAGMFLSSILRARSSWRFPRVRGDVPGSTRCSTLYPGFSPRARGCSLECIAVMNIMIVFPACAGMFRAINEPIVSINPFSPRARGCSHSCKTPTVSGRVFPACAGMFPGFLIADSSRRSFPRVRGDVPTREF